jgi:hypothetical protein
VRDIGAVRENTAQFESVTKRNFKMIYKSKKLVDTVDAGVIAEIKKHSSGELGPDDKNSPGNTQHCERRVRLDPGLPRLRQCWLPCDR